MKVFARHRLSSGRLQSDEPALLLEGSWPTAERSRRRWSLDEALDGRHADLDQHAAALADRCARPEESFAWLNIVKLRYHFVKLLRVVRFFRELRPLASDARLQLFVAPGRDEVYAEVFQELARAGDFELDVCWTEADQPPRPQQLANARWRRLAARINGWTNPGNAAKTAAPRVVLCGNRRLLDPVCAELVRRQVRSWWLYERFAVGVWLAWRRRGVGQLVCDNAENSRTPAEFSADMGQDGINLQAAVGLWHDAMLKEFGPRQSELLTQIESHFRAVRPTHVVLDQDGTPFNRAVVAIARRMGAKTLIVQHGVPYVRFGFARLEADQICAWGESSREQFLRWGIPDERIVVTGCPAHDRLIDRISSSKHRRNAGPRKILFFATLPPSDERPDVLGYHLTTESYRQLLRTALAAVNDLPGAELLIKPHPRDLSGGPIRQALAAFPRLNATIVAGKVPFERLVNQADTVLSCASSAGVEATLAGVPVIQLMPEGSSDLLLEGAWGFLGTARRRAELDELLVRAAEQPRLGPDPRVFANLDSSASAHVVDALFGTRTSASDSRRAVPTTAQAEV